MELSGAARDLLMRACAEELGVKQELEELGVEVIYWGEPLTTLLRDRAPLLTV